MRIIHMVFLLLGMAVFVIVAQNLYSGFDRKAPCMVNQPLDSLDGVYVYCNGHTRHISGRHVTSDHYNLGMKYQCVEFVKRYYYLHYKHKMPESYGDAKSFFDPEVQDGGINKDRNLVQYTNSGCEKPAKGDILVFNKTRNNPFGHVAIVSEVRKHTVEVIQQNKTKTREFYGLCKRKNKWHILNKRVLGWLRIKDK